MYAINKFYDIICSVHLNLVGSHATSLVAVVYKYVQTMFYPYMAKFCARSTQKMKESWG